MRNVFAHSRLNPLKFGTVRNTFVPGNICNKSVSNERGYAEGVNAQQCERLTNRPTPLIASNVRECYTMNRVFARALDHTRVAYVPVAVRCKCDSLLIAADLANLCRPRGQPLKRFETQEIILNSMAHDKNP